MNSISCFSNRCMSRTVKIMFLTLITVITAMVVSAAPPVGQTIWIKASANGRFVSADQNRGAFAPLVADRASASTWEHFRWGDLAGGAFTLTGRATGRFVSADLARGTFAPLFSDRVTASTWETFTWGAVGGNPNPTPTPTPTPNPTPTPTPGGAPPGFPNLIWSDE